MPDLILTSTLTRSLETAALAFPNQFVACQGRPPTAAVQTTELLNDQVVAWADVVADDAQDELSAHKPQLARFHGAHSASRYHHAGCDPAQPLRPRRWAHVTAPQDGHTAEFARFKPLEAQHPDQFTYPEETRESAQLRAALVWRLLADVPHARVAVFTHAKLIKHGYHIHLLGPLICETALGEFESGQGRGWETVAAVSLERDPVDELSLAELVDDLEEQALEKQAAAVEEAAVPWVPGKLRARRWSSSPASTNAAPASFAASPVSGGSGKACIQCGGTGKIKADVCPMCAGAGTVSARTIAFILGGGR